MLVLRLWNELVSLSYSMWDLSFNGNTKNSFRKLHHCMFVCKTYVKAEGLRLLCLIVPIYIQEC